MENSIQSIEKLRKRFGIDKMPYDLAFEVSEIIIESRIKSSMTQKKLAEKVGTKQAAIARAENGAHLPSLSFLEKIAKAMKMQVKVSFIQKH